ncbi:Uncharacterised protein [Chlamydia trachomatis]|nr:Uncharacterised protein [Chlamydia trachomatis]
MYIVSSHSAIIWLLILSTFSAYDVVKVLYSFSNYFSNASFAFPSIISFFRVQL